MPPEHSPFLPRGYVPQTHRPVLTSRSQGLAVRTECHREDCVRMSLENGPLLTRAHVPQTQLAPVMFRRWVSTYRGQSLAVRAERQRIDPAGMLPGNSLRLPG